MAAVREPLTIEKCGTLLGCSRLPSDSIRVCLLKRPSIRLPLPRSPTMQLLPTRLTAPVHMQATSYCPCIKPCWYWKRNKFVGQVTFFHNSCDIPLDGDRSWTSDGVLSDSPQRLVSRYLFLWFQDKHVSGDNFLQKFDVPYILKRISRDLTLTEIF